MGPDALQITRDFINRRCETDPQARTPIDDLYGEYVLWCVERGVEPGYVTQFSLLLRLSGLDRRRTRVGNRIVSAVHGLRITQ